MNGLWLLSEANDNQSLTGYVTQYTVTVDPQPPLSGFWLTLGADQWFDDYIIVPNDATNLIISALYESEGTNAAGTGPIGIYLTNFDDLNTSDYGSNNIGRPEVLSHWAAPTRYPAGREARLLPAASGITASTIPARTP